MLNLPEHWSWDFWLADDGVTFHLFYLHAPRDLGDERLRHAAAQIGHATSTDLRGWQVHGPVLAPQPGPAFDDQAVWTGCVVPDPAGGWRMFHSGIDRAGPAAGGLVQGVGTATSPDLFTWAGRAAAPLLQPDPRWYATAGQDESPWQDLHWRDPWVFTDPNGDGWHMLLTARAAADPRTAADDRGVIGHAVSPDLRRWTVRPPLSAPGAGFGQLEVPQVEVVEGRAVLMFSCLPGELSEARRTQFAGAGSCGVWAVVADDVRGPFDVAAARPVTGAEFYAGRMVRDRAGGWNLMAFHNAGPDGSFTGGLSDPMPITVSAGDLVVLRDR